MVKKLFKKKQKRESSGVIFKNKHRSQRRSQPSRKKRLALLPVLFKKKKKRNSKRRIRGATSLKSNLLQLAILIIVPGLLIFGAYRGIITVIQIRSAQNADIEGVYQIKGYVIGFDDVPIYPDSRFIYEEYKDEPAVQEFLTDGKAVYRQPLNSNIAEIFTFYKDVLPESDWKHVLSVDRADDERMFGEYWVKGDIGLRIFNELNDIWYEKISPTQAKSGLSDRVKAESERELIVSATSGTELLPDFPWNLRVPTEYLVRYYATELGDLRGAEFNKIGSNKKILLEPIGTLDQIPDTLLESFLITYNKREEIKDSWEVVNSQYIEKGGKEVLEVDIVSGNRDARVFVVPNQRNSYYYVITAFEKSNTFVDFLIETLEEKKSDYTGEDFDF